MVVARKLICDDGTVLYSRYRHDYQSYTDKNGKFYMLDGGLGEYYRTSGTGKVIEITTENNSWEEIREEYSRYNKYSQSYVKLKDIPDSWLQNIIDWCIEYDHRRELFKIFLEEKLYRAENFIYIAEDSNYQIDYAA